MHWGTQTRFEYLGRIAEGKLNQQFPKASLGSDKAVVSQNPTSQAFRGSGLAVIRPRRDLRALIISRRALDFRVDHCSDKQR